MSNDRSSFSKSALALANATVRALNPDVFGVAPVGPKKPKRDKGSGREDPPVGESAPRLGYRITLIRFGRKRLDSHDNLRGAFKPLVDRITESLGFKSDDDPQLSWHYAQVETTGTPGCIVSIQIERKS